MNTILFIAAIAVFAVLSFLALRKSQQANEAPATPAPSTDHVAPGPQKVTALTTEDYVESFFSGSLNGAPIKPYDLPAGARGFGPGGGYDKHALDPRPTSSHH